MKDLKWFWWLYIPVAIGFAVTMTMYGCVSLGGAKQAGFQAFAVAHTSLMLVRNVEKDLVCGQPTAPTAPLCVNDATHGKVLEILKEGFTIDGDLGRLVQALPEGVATTPEVGTLIGKITVLISDVLQLIPKSPQQKALADKVAK